MMIWSIIFTDYDAFVTKLCVVGKLIHLVFKRIPVTKSMKTMEHLPILGYPHTVFTATTHS
jgi:hypothetical protein